MRRLLFILFVVSVQPQAFAQDTLRVMTYNVLHYGDRCQGSNSFLHANLKTIVQYENPDVLGLVKVQSIRISSTDFYGVSQIGFADSILNSAMNAAYPNKYDHCQVVNFSGDQDDDMDLLYFNKSKLGFLSVVNLCSTQEDFNLYKLFYRDPNLATTKDTTFLYFILNHTISGTDEVQRDIQDSTVVKNLRKRFHHLPNLISMGDFNTHSSYEAGYQLLTATTDSSFIFSDPPFSPDKKISYPANWQDNSSAYAAYLNTSTRETTLPNPCGTDGGAKNWYLHILMSPWIVKSSNYVKYIPNSYVTIGNDGSRVGVSVNDSSIKKNSSVPPNVLASLFQLSDKYPVMIKLAVTPNINGTSPEDPDIPQTVTGVIEGENGGVKISNPVEEEITFYFPSAAVGALANLQWNDLVGRMVASDGISIDATQMQMPVNLPPGIYVLRVLVNNIQTSFRVVKR